MGNAGYSGHMAGEMQWIAKSEGIGRREGLRERERERATNAMWLRSKTTVIGGLLVMLCGREVRWLHKSTTRVKLPIGVP